MCETQTQETTSLPLQHKQAHTSRSQECTHPDTVNVCDLYVTNVNAFKIILKRNDPCSPCRTRWIGFSIYSKFHGPCQCAPVYYANHVFQHVKEKKAVPAEPVLIMTSKTGTVPKIGVNCGTFKTTQKLWTSELKSIYFFASSFLFVNYDILQVGKSEP